MGSVKPEVTQRKPLRFRYEDGTYFELPPDTKLYAVTCEHKLRPHECGPCLDKSMGVHIQTRYGEVFVPTTYPGDIPSTPTLVMEASVRQLLMEAFTEVES